MLAAFTVAIFFLTSFLASSAAVIVAWKIIQARSSAAAEAALTLDSPRLLKDEALSTVSPLAVVLKHFNFVHGVKARIAEAGLSWSVGRLTAMMLLCGALAAAVLMSLTWLPSWIALGASGLATIGPYLYVLRRRRVRLSRFEEQLPDALDFLSRALRAGHPFAVSLEMLAQESTSPLGAEMRKTHDERQLGMSWDQALENLAARVPVIDVSFFAAAVRLQSRTGGKLGEVLGRLAETMRERFVLRGEVRAISAHGRLTGMILTAIPLIVAAILTVVNPAYLNILITHPRGKDLILGAIVCVVAAHFVIRRIVTIKL